MEPVGPGISLTRHPHPSTALSGGWPHCLSSGSRVRAPSVEKQAWVLGRTPEKIDGLHTGYSKCLLFPFERNAMEFLELPRPPSWAVEDSIFPKSLLGVRVSHVRLSPGCTHHPHRVFCPGLAELAHGTPRITEAENGPMDLVKSVVGFGCPCACTCAELCTRGPMSRSRQKRWGCEGDRGSPSRLVVCGGRTVSWAMSSVRGRQRWRGGGGSGDFCPPWGPPASGACGGHSGQRRGLACPWVASRAQGRAGRPDPVRLGRDPAGTLAWAGQRLPRAWGMAVSPGEAVRDCCVLQQDPRGLRTTPEVAMT